MLWRPMSPASGSKGAHADRPGARGAGALLALGLAAGGLAAAAGAPGLELSACELEHPQRLTVVAAECGVLPVAENPRDPAGRHVPLRVARVPAISRRKQPDALFILAGGPGAAASAFYATVAGAFARIHRERDIVLVDQRGSGGSNRLDCEADAQLLYRASEAEIAAGTRSEEHTSELQSQSNLVCRLLLEKKKKITTC